MVYRIASSNGVQYHQQDTKKANQHVNSKTEVQFEIEFPRCCDAMTLYSDLITYTSSGKNVTFTFTYNLNEGFLKLLRL